MTVFIDTAPLIYLIERDDDRVRNQIEQWIRADECLLSSCVTLSELLVHPRKNKNRRLEHPYRLYLKRLVNTPLLPVDEKVAESAADIRASYGFRIPDALQLAAATTSGCESFYTNDHRLRSYLELNILLVGE